MLWYLTALGDHILVPEGGKFVEKMKKSREQEQKRGFQR